MDRETRSDKMYRLLNEFVADNNTTSTTMVLYKGEIEKLGKHLSQKNIDVEIAEKKYLGKGKSQIILKKM